MMSRYSPIMLKITFTNNYAIFWNAKFGTKRVDKGESLLWQMATLETLTLWIFVERQFDPYQLIRCITSPLMQYKTFFTNWNLHSFFNIRYLPTKISDKVDFKVIMTSRNQNNRYFNLFTLVSATDTYRFYSV